jgi:hypothetical protein
LGSAVAVVMGYFRTKVGTRFCMLLPAGCATLAACEAEIGLTCTPHRSHPIMGIWNELGISLVVIAFGFDQLHDVKKAQRERRTRGQAAKAAEAASNDQQSGERKP